MRFITIHRKASTLMVLLLFTTMHSCLQVVDAFSGLDMMTAPLRPSYDSIQNRRSSITSLQSCNDDELQVDRRTMLASMAAAASLLTAVGSANAFDTKAYPVELSAVDGEEEVDSRARKVNQIIRNQKAQRDADGPIEIINSIVWGGALWLLSGSRSNPIATPLANIIYNVKQEEWLQDRNEGLFAKLPWEFLVIIAFVFVGLGYGTNALTTALAEGDGTISLQLAGVSLIAGGALELGRIFSGEKRPTRQESDRGQELGAEFDQFATDRLTVGRGNCHRSEVVQAFRRYNAKYRQADSEEYPLTDLEIEQLLRTYCRARGVEMSSAGFYSGIQINQDADVFVAK